MAIFRCPFCNNEFPLIYGRTYKEYHSSFHSADKLNDGFTPHNVLTLKFYLCEICYKNIVLINNCTGDFENISISVYPNSLAHKYPDYIPKQIINDYNEAYSILHLSPKASATLARRCLQGMIRDFWNIHKGRLTDEIDALENIIPSLQWKAIDNLRKIGNIGAHMEKDVNLIIDIEPNEAEQLLHLIELLLDKWYITRHDEEELVKSIQSITDKVYNLKNHHQ